MMVQYAKLFLFMTGLAMAESHPSWWGLASPDATAIVGIRWDTRSHSVFGAPVEGELWGSLNFPDLVLLHESRQILISSPATVAMFTGNFPLVTLHQQAAAQGMKQISYRGTEMWIAPSKTLSLAVMSDQLVVVGMRKSLQDAIDRSQAESGTSRKYSPLLARGARLAPTKDLWVVATRLPDPLADLFVPLETEARGFDGGISVRDGVQLEATLEAGSEDAAAVIADNLRHTVLELPKIARGLQVTAEADYVLLGLEVSKEQLVAGMKGSVEPAPAPAPTVAAA